MLSAGRECLKGHRMQLYIIELWILLCWLVPIATELLARRFLPTTIWWQGITLCGSFLLNRILLAPAHVGYYVCCKRLAMGYHTEMAATCEIDDLQTAVPFTTILRGFFAEYRHIPQAIKKQLQWDIWRLFCYAVAGFPGILLIALGGLEQQALLQALLCGSGILLGAAGELAAWIFVRRLQVAWYSRPQMIGSWKQAIQQTCKLSGKLLRRYAKALPWILIPFSLQRFVLHVEIAILLRRHPISLQPKNSSQIFHTRVLRET